MRALIWQPWCTPLPSRRYNRFGRFDRLIDRWEPVLQRAFLEGIFRLRSAAQVERIARELEAGNLDNALRAVNLNPTAFRALDTRTREAFISGGDTTLAAFPEMLDAEGFRFAVRFNISNPEAERWLADRSSRRVVEILADQRNMIRDFLSYGLSQGDNPRTSALDLVGRIGASGRREGGVIGLTNSQMQWVRNYKAELQSDNPLQALERGLRDRRFDGIVRRAAERGERIAAGKITSMVTAYMNRALRFRAEAIARTETMAALHESQQQAIEQTVQDGLLTYEQVRFRWRTAGDARVRDSHDAMEGQTVGLGEYFVSGLGNRLEYPGDPSAPPEDIINCRCWRQPDVDFLAGVT